MRALTLRDPAVIGRAAGAPAFHPVTSIAWHAAFWTGGADFAALGLSNGAAVTTWPDETANGRDLTQATAGSKPTYTASSAGFNSHPTVACDGTADFMQTASWTGITGTIVVVGKLTGGSTSKTIVDGIGSSNRHLLFSNSSAKWSINSGTSIASAGSSDTSLHYFRAEFGATDTLTIDGTSSISGDAGAQTLTGITLGARYDGTTNFGAIEAAFIGVLSGALTTDERTALRAWAQATYLTP